VGGFSILEHTADTGVQSWGASLEEALAWLAKGMFSLLADPDTVEARQSVAVSVSARDSESMAVDWLNELLYRHEAEGFLLKDCQVILSAPGRLEAECQGEFLDPARHQILTVIKAATYHQVQVTAENNQWRIQVVLDV